MEETTIRRNYKDSLFRMLFREKPELLSLYNAVNGTSYKNTEDLEILTIEDALYMSVKNDSAFLIEDYLNLYEAQSTLNPNMPLRGVFYFSSLYRSYIAEHNLDIYSNAQLKLPAPKYVVFYNGTSPAKERWTERLSASFGDFSGNSDEEGPVLECTALIININYGKNRQMMESCQKLYEYSYFIEEVRKGLRTGLKLAPAVDLAVECCIRKGILSRFLTRHRAEVKNVILTEYNEELHIRSEKKLSYNEGAVDNAAKNLLTLLAAHGTVSDSLKERILSEKDLDTLDKWFILAINTSSPEEFEKKC